MHKVVRKTVVNVPEWLRAKFKCSKSTEPDAWGMCQYLLEGCRTRTIQSLEESKEYRKQFYSLTWLPGATWLKTAALLP